MTDEYDLPPWDERAEQSALGATMLSSRALADIVETLQPEDFYKPHHQVIYRAVLRLEQAGQPVDPVTLGSELERHNELERVGGAPFLHTLMSACPTAANAPYYADRVLEQATRRGLLQASQRIAQLACNSTASADEFVEDARQTLDQVTTRSRTDAPVHDLDDLAANALARYAAPEPPSLSTGDAQLDGLLGGLRPGTLTVIGARPGVGKSVLGINIATHAASRGEGALLVSLEMPETEVTDRVLANIASVELDRITKHRLSPNCWGRLRDASVTMKGWPLRVVDQANLSLAGIRSVARDHVRTPRGLGVLVVDYLQLIRPADPRAPREQQVASFSRGLKLLAKELGLPVVALAQVNRGSEQRSDRRPVLADLRESGSIEADADAVLLLHHDPEHPGEIETTAAKNRHGRIGTVHLAWSPHYARAGASPIAA